MGAAPFGQATGTDIDRIQALRRAAQRSLQDYLGGVDPMAMALAGFAGAAAPFGPATPNAQPSCGVLTECRTVSASEVDTRPGAAIMALSPEFTPGFLSRSSGNQEPNAPPPPGTGSLHGGPTDLTSQEESRFLLDLTKRVLVSLGILHVSRDVPKVALIVGLLLCLALALLVERTRAARRTRSSAPKPQPVSHKPRTRSSRRHRHRRRSALS